MKSALWVQWGQPMWRRQRRRQHTHLCLFIHSFLSDRLSGSRYNFNVSSSNNIYLDFIRWVAHRICSSHEPSMSRISFSQFSISQSLNEIVRKMFLYGEAANEFVLFLSQASPAQKMYQLIYLWQRTRIRIGERSSWEQKMEEKTRTERESEMEKR